MKNVPSTKWGVRLSIAALSALVIVGATRFVTSGVLASDGGIFTHPAWFAEQLPPVLRLRESHLLIDAIDRRQYGVVVIAGFDPVVTLFRGDERAIELFALISALAAILGAFVLLERRFAWGGLRGRLLRVAMWLNFVPLVMDVSERIVDTWVLFFLALALVLLTASARWRAMSGLPIAMGMLTKLLPGVLLLYLAGSHVRAALVGVASAIAMLCVGQLLYGPLLGLGYPFAILGAAGESAEIWSTHQENNSIRGLLFKFAAGFRVEADAVQRVDFAPTLSAAAYAIAGTLLLILLWQAWRGKADQSREGVSLRYSSAISAMLLVSPHTAHEHTLVTLIPFSVLLWSWSRGGLSVGRRFLLALSLVLVGIFIPVSLATKLLMLDKLVELTGNARVSFLENIGAYDYFGLVGLGLLLLWYVLAMRAPATPFTTSRRPSARDEREAPILEGHNRGL